MKEKTYNEPVSDMAASYGQQARQMLARCPGCGQPSHACQCSLAKAHAPVAEQPKRGMLAKAMTGLRDLMAKSQVKGYTKSDGTQVLPYTNKVQAQAHPAKNFAPGAQVYHPHPAKPGKQGLGTYKGTTEDGSQSVVEHGGKQFAVPHEAVKGARGLPGGSAKVGQLSAPEKTKEAGDYVRKMQAANGGSIKGHPNFEPDDYQALKDKGYSDDEIKGLWDQDTKRNGGVPTGGQKRDDLKLPTREHPDGQIGPAAKAAAKEAAAKKAAPKQPSAKGSATGATPKQLEMMEDSLANNEDGDDQELIDLFVSQGVPEAVAKQAVTHRDAFLSQVAPPRGLLAKLMKKDAAGKGGSADAGNAKHKAGDMVQDQNGDKRMVTKDHDGGDGPVHTDGGQFHPSKVKATKAAGDVSRGTADSPDGKSGGSGESGAANVPPQADANEAGWGELPDDENPQHALSQLSSKHLGQLATGKPEHAKAYAHHELANRGMDSNGSWVGFDQAKAHHSGSMPSDFQPDPGVAEHMQTQKGKVLTAAAQGHLDLQKRAKAQLANRGHDTQGNWVGFDKANELHGIGKKGGDMAKAMYVLVGDAPVLTRK